MYHITFIKVFNQGLLSILQMQLFRPKVKFLPRRLAKQHEKFAYLLEGISATLIAYFFLDWLKDMTRIFCELEHLQNI